MRSVADDLKDEDRRAIAAMSPAERVALALGARDVESFARSHTPPLTLEEAARLLQRQRQLGRRRSRCHEEAIG
jgi:hypothetical protein